MILQFLKKNKLKLNQSLGLSEVVELKPVSSCCWQMKAGTLPFGPGVTFNFFGLTPTLKAGGCSGFISHLIYLKSISLLVWYLCCVFVLDG